LLVRMEGTLAGVEVAVPEVSPEDLVYLEKVRLATKRLSYKAPAPDDLASALQSVRDVSQFDIDVPTQAHRREVEVLKTGVKRLLTWYMRYLAVQLNNFSAATTHVAEVLVSRTERLERGSGDLEARLGALEERVRRLEDAAGRARGVGGPPPGEKSAPRKAGAGR